MFRYAHTNIVAKDSQKLIRFYKEVFHCRSIGETRDMRAQWIDDVSGLENAHIVGEHLGLPGFDENSPTLEIFSFDSMVEAEDSPLNRCGLSHLAFEVDDVEETIQAVLQAGGSQLGKVIKATYPGKIATRVFVRDPEGNLVEVQSWKKTE